MRNITIALAILFAATTANAVDLGGGLSLNTELKAFHKVDAETNHITVEPEIRWTQNALSIYVESPITVFETNHASGDNVAIMNVWDNGHKPLLEFGIEYDINPKTQAYAETTYDNNASKRGEIQVGVSFNF